MHGFGVYVHIWSLHSATLAFAWLLHDFGVATVGLRRYMRCCINICMVLHDFRVTTVGLHRYMSVHA